MKKRMDDKQESIIEKIKENISKENKEIIDSMFELLDSEEEKNNYILFTGVDTSCPQESISTMK